MDVYDKIQKPTTTNTNAIKSKNYISKRFKFSIKFNIFYN